MSDPIATIFARQLAAMESLIRSQWAWPSPEAGFALHVYLVAKEVGPVPPIAADWWPEASSLRHAQTVAASGYLLGSQPTLATQHNLADWAAALDRVTQKEPFPLDRQSFTFRPLEVLGISLGTSVCPAVTSGAKARLIDIVTRLADAGNDDAWSLAIYSLAAHILAVSWNKTALPALSILDAPTLALLKWMTTAYNSVPLSVAVLPHTNSLDLELLRACGTAQLEIDDIARAAVLHYSLNRTVCERIESAVSRTWPVNKEVVDALAIVERLCRRFHLFARQLEQRRKDVPVAGTKDREGRSTIVMKDEYDVQDAMFALLRLYFDDVRGEEYTPSYAGSTARMDFLLKRERIVIETKMTRATLRQKEVVKQLIIDKDHYRKHPDCETLVCFVYDPEGFCDNPVALEDDVSGQDGKLRTVTIVGPKGV